MVSIFNQLLPKYFSNKEKKTVVMPSLIVEGAEDFGIEDDFSVLEKDLKTYYGNNDLENAFVEKFQNDEKMIEVFNFMATFTNVQKMQLNNYFYSFAPSFQGLSENRQKKQLQRVLDQLIKNRFILKSYVPGPSERKIPSYSLSQYGFQLAIHMRTKLKLDSYVRNPSIIEYYSSRSTIVKKQWVNVDVYLAALTLKNIVGYKNRFVKVQEEGKNPLFIKESQAVLSIMMKNEKVCNLITYTVLPEQGLKYIGIVAEQWNIIGQDYTDRPIPGLGGDLNFLAIIVYNLDEAKRVAQSINETLPASPVFIILENIQKESVLDGFVFWEDGEFLSFSRFMGLESKSADGVA
ncbi:hypothetical protein [Lactococcus lactis]|jgi:hypothetical protein|uniref:hypothetical protein n=1 Tax=Lactococcus lactis TaxID=1358 RepID=UPI00288E3E41|nr:hypothetical protein [Lactococcus lactis]MDT2909310.1 hypothetical protein [Lactococcus lactis]MDT2925160.1 hypothetical protein [Lactococcus lactis]MDT2952019.1 hypothetical protein [Lactococcus lactis]